MRITINGWIVAIFYVLIGFGISFLLLKEEPKTIYVEKEVEVIKEIKIEPKFETFEVTAYTAGYESTGKNPGDKYYGITASGQRAWERITLACPKSMEFGTKVYIPAFETVFTCTDRGSAITEGKLDVYMEELEDALSFGRQHLEVFILP
jgi:3D (Asp-Asp-Asp) domain-containing protein